MLANTPKEVETIAAYKQRLRSTALRVPRAVVSEAVNKMAVRIRELKAANGGSMPSD